MELSIGWVGGDYAFVSADLPKYKNLLNRLRKEYPDQVIMIAGNPDNPNPKLRENDNCVYAKVPLSWIRIRPPVKREMTDEQREAARERLAKARAAKSASDTDAEVDLNLSDDFPDDLENEALEELEGEE